MLLFHASLVWVVMNLLTDKPETWGSALPAGQKPNFLPLVDQLRRSAADTHKEPWPPPVSPQLRLCWSPDRHDCLLFPTLSCLYCPVQSLSCVWLFVTPWIVASQVSLSITNSKCYSNSYPSCWWCRPTISSSVVPFSSCLQSFPASESFRRSRFFTSGGPKHWRFSFSIRPSNEYSFAALLLTIQDRQPLFQKVPGNLTPPLVPNFGYMTEVRTLSPEWLFPSRQWSQLSLALPWTVSFLWVEAIPTELSKGLGT